MVALTRRQCLTGSAVLAGSALLAPLTSLANTLGTAPLRVWRYKGLASSFMDLAGQLDTPYPVEWVDISGGNLVLEALSSASLDYVYMSEIPPIFASVAKVPIALVASLPGDTGDLGLVVKNDSGIDAVAGLKGKKISYVRATNTHYWLLRLLERNGLSVADVQPVPMPIQESLIAFQNGHVDAVIGGGVSILQAERANGRRLENVSDYPNNMLIATSQRVLQDATRRAQLADFLRREQATWAWVHDHPEQWAQRSEQLTGIAAELYLEQFRRRAVAPRLTAVSEQSVSSQQQVADAFFQQRLIRQPVDVRPLWHADFKNILSTDPL